MPMYRSQQFSAGRRSPRFGRVAATLASLALLPALAACDAAQAKPDVGTVAPEGTSAEPAPAVAQQQERCPVSPEQLAYLQAADTAPRMVAGAGDSATAAAAVSPARAKADSVRRAVRARWARAQLQERLPGSILPGCRILAYYGNPLSKKMGALGEYQVDEMLSRLDAEVARWQKADPTVKVQPALHLIAVVAQGGPGRDGKYRLRMTDSLIERVASWAERKDALLFLDIQVGLSTIQEELPRLLPFLERPYVHLGIDPEFSMKDGTPPGKKIGTYDAADINYVIRTLSEVVERKNLPPKVLVVHRFTRKMVTNSDKIRLDPRVQFVMHMDGWGGKTLKIDSYKSYVVNEPVQFAGFKIFYYNDQRKPGTRVMTAEEVLQLEPRPLYIQYQ